MTGLNQLGVKPLFSGALIELMTEKAGTKKQPVLKTKFDLTVHQDTVTLYNGSHPVELRDDELMLKVQNKTRGEEGTVYYHLDYLPEVRAFIDELDRFDTDALDSDEKRQLNEKLTRILNNLNRAEVMPEAPDALWEALDKVKSRIPYAITNLNNTYVGKSDTNDPKWWFPGESNTFDLPVKASKVAGFAKSAGKVMVSILALGASVIPGGLGWMTANKIAEPNQPYAASEQLIEQVKTLKESGLLERVGVNDYQVTPEARAQLNDIVETMTKGVLENGEYQNYDAVWAIIQQEFPSIATNAEDAYLVEEIINVIPSIQDGDETTTDAEALKAMTGRIINTLYYNNREFYDILKSRNLTLEEVITGANTEIDNLSSDRTEEKVGAFFLKAGSVLPFVITAGVLGAKAKRAHDEKRYR